MSRSFETPNSLVLLSNSGWREPTPGLFFWAPDWQETPQSVAAGKWKRSELQHFPGHWALIDVRGEHPKVVVDRQRSRPLVAARVSGRWLIADQIENLRGRVPFEPNEEAVSIFPHFGYTLSSATLISGVHDCPAACEMILASEPKFRPYMKFSLLADAVDNQDEFNDQFTKALDTVFSRLLAEVGDRQLIVPLSAGHDSRLILTWLRRHDAKNVLAFSYGTDEAWERDIARQVAKALGYPFIFVHQTENEVREAWQTPSGERFLRNAWGGTSVPHRQDWFAVKQLVERGVASDDAIVLPGHSVPSGTGLESPEGTKADMDFVARLLARKTEQNQVQTVLSHPAFRRALSEAADQVGFGDRELSNAELLQWFSLRERQAKFITNSVRVYEHFGLGWAMPLHEPEVWSARRRASRQLLAGRTGYDQFVSSAFQNMTGLSIPRGTPKRRRKLADSRLWRASIGRTRFARPITRKYELWVPRTRKILGLEDSPFGSEGYHPKRTLSTRISRSLSGETRNGSAAKSFLADQTGVPFNIFDDHDCVSSRTPHHQAETRV